VVCPRTGGDSPELKVGGDDHRDLRWAFIGTRGGMVAWARAAGGGETKGKTRGAAALLVPAGLGMAPAAPTTEECRRVEAS
jgi:hypothetical protein